MRWPFGPPHLTLKPSKTTKKKDEEGKNKKEKNKQRKTKIPKIELFSYQADFSVSIVGGPKFPFFDNSKWSHAFFDW